MNSNRILKPYLCAYDYKGSPEEKVKELIIEKIFEITKTMTLGREVSLPYIDGKRRPDYARKNVSNDKFLLEAKEEGNKKGIESDIDKIKNILRLKENSEWTFGVITDGFTWVFVRGKNEERYHIEKDFDDIIRCIKGGISNVTKKEITDAFWKKYKTELYGKKNDVSYGLVNNIDGIESNEDKKTVAQMVINRMIFIKFLESKQIIDNDILTYIIKKDVPDIFNSLESLFFDTMNVPECRRRKDIDSKFYEIRYLNSSLFTRILGEENKDYRINGNVIKRIINFLSNYEFVSYEKAESGVIDPEILGYIFERAMNEDQKKSSGSYYTSKTITKNISRNAIYPYIVKKVNDFLGTTYSSIDDLIDNYPYLNVKEKTYVFEKIILGLSICDPSCGSGAFLWASANVLFDICCRLKESIDAPINKIRLKKQILRCIYGVDINFRAVEIAMLRMWLWLAEEYTYDTVEPLPNIDTNFKVGDSLSGFRGGKNINIYISDSVTQKVIEDRKKYFSGEIQKIERLTDISFIWHNEFPEVFKKGGFDIVIGNPPYGNLLEISDKKFLKSKYKSSLSEIAGLFVERCNVLLKKGGTLSFIITFAITFGTHLSKTRNFIYNNFDNCYISTFDRDTYHIFDSMTQSVSIMSCLNYKSRDGKCKFFTSEFLRNPVELDDISFSEVKSILNVNMKRVLSIDKSIKDKHRLPKIGSYSKIIDKICTKNKKIGDVISTRSIDFKGNFFIRNSGNFWYNAWDRKPYSSTHIKELHVSDKYYDFLILLMNSSLFYVWMRVFGSSRDINYDILKAFPIPSKIKHEDKLTSMRETLMIKLFDVFDEKNCKFNTRKIKDFIDEIDDFLGKEFYNLTDNEIDNIKNTDSIVRNTYKK